MWNQSIHFLKTSLSYTHWNSSREPSFLNLRSQLLLAKTLYTFESTLHKYPIETPHQKLLKRLSKSFCIDDGAVFALTSLVQNVNGLAISLMLVSYLYNLKVYFYSLTELRISEGENATVTIDEVKELMSAVRKEYLAQMKNMKAVKQVDLMKNTPPLDLKSVQTGYIEFFKQCYYFPVKFPSIADVPVYK